MKTVVRCIFSQNNAFQLGEDSRGRRDDSAKWHAFFTGVKYKIVRQVVSLLDIYVIEADGLVFKKGHYFPPLWSLYFPILYRKLII